MSSTHANEEDSVVLDPKSIESLRKLSAGNPEFLLNLFGAYLQQCETGIPDLERMVASGESTAMGNLAHKLKGGAAQLGAVAMSEVCKQIEQIGRAESTEGVESLLSEARVQYGRLKEAVAALGESD
ncbi:MAG: Hpt domain-containing protein [Planctomycetota bacterium]|jgi:HPt (histidine-containing phosphotransfer) domain-containing protein|nr:Hpt domain-containing protein [Planctomycetota bacterium]